MGETKDASPYAHHWALDSSIDHLNHGSFGACPRVVLDYQRTIQDQFERSPVPFVTRKLRPLYDQARECLAETVGADPRGVVAVSNATAGVNTVLRSLEFQPGDEILVSDHGYNACSNVARYLAERIPGVKVVVAEIPFPLNSEQTVVDAVFEKLSAQTKLVLLDHVTSPTGMILPIKQIIDELNARGVASLIDGAHAPGMLPLNLVELDATFYTGNCHKWLCSPKSVGFLYVAPRARGSIVPLVVSHGWNTKHSEAPRLHKLFDWPGTFDPSVWLSVPVAIEFLRSLLPGGLPELQEMNHKLCLEARRLLCELTQVPPPCPESMLGSLATIVLADQRVQPHEYDETMPTPCDPLIRTLLDEHRIDVPVFTWNETRMIRVSAQAYNDIEQYRRLGNALT